MEIALQLLRMSPRRSVGRLLAIGMVAAVLAGQAAAGAQDGDWFARAGAALEAGDCGAAVDLMEAALATGEPDALYPEREFFLFRPCPDKGAVERIYAIALRQREGRGSPLGDESAMLWLEWAEYLGVAAARYLLAMDGLEADEDDWLSKNRLEWAAIGGHGSAQAAWARYQLERRPGALGRSEALVWLLRARQNGAGVLDEIKQISTGLPSFQVNRAVKEARRAPEGISELFWEPNFHVARNKLDCAGVVRILAEAVKKGRDRAVAEMGSTLGRKYGGRGSGCAEIDTERRREILEYVVARLPNHLPSKLRLAEFYLEGPFGETYATQARNLLRMAALTLSGQRRPDFRAALVRAMMPDGPAAAAAFKDAVRWFEALEAQGGCGFYRIGEMFESGDGLPRNAARAKAWKERGKELGLDGACKSGSD